MRLHNVLGVLLNISTTAVYITHLWVYTIFTPLCFDMRVPVKGENIQARQQQHRYTSIHKLSTIFYELYLASLFLNVPLTDCAAAIVAFNSKCVLSFKNIV